MQFIVKELSRLERKVEVNSGTVGCLQRQAIQSGPDFSTYAGTLHQRATVVLLLQDALLRVSQVDATKLLHQGLHLLETVLSQSWTNRLHP